MIPLVPTNVHDPLSFNIGDDWFLEFDCNDMAGNPLDLTGAQIEWRLTSDDADETIILTLALDSGISLIPLADTNATPNACQVWVPNAMTAGIAPGYYRDRLRVMTWENIVTTQAVGRIEAIET